MNRQQTIEIVKNWLADLDDNNGVWLQSYDDAASYSLADCIVYEGETFKDKVNEAFSDVKEADYDDFVQYLIDLGDWKAEPVLFGEPSGLAVGFGSIGEHELQLDSLNTYKQSIETVCCDVYIKDDCAYLYDYRYIYFTLQGDYDEIFRDFAERMNQSRQGLLLSDSRGVYIPRDFMQGFDLEAWNICEPDEALNDPYNEWYWEAWQHVLDNAYMIDDKGVRWSLLQDGDLWAIREDYYHLDC